MTDLNAINAALDAGHAAVLADAALYVRAVKALPILRGRRGAFKAQADDHAKDIAGRGSNSVKQAIWHTQGGEGAYGRQLGCEEYLMILTAVVEKASPSGWLGWLRRDDVERAFSVAGV